MKLNELLTGASTGVDKKQDLILVAGEPYEPENYRGKGPENSPDPFVKRELMKGPSESLKERTRIYEEETFVDFAQRRLKTISDRKNGSTFFGTFSDWLYRGDDDAFEKLKTLAATMERNRQTGTRISQKQQQDFKNQLRRFESESKGQEKMDLWTNAAFKIAPLFIPGRTGWVLAAATNALDTVQTSSSSGRQIVDFTLGSIKGLALRGALEGAPRVTSNLALQGVGLGMASRALETGLTSDSYIIPKTNQVDLTRGLGKTVERTFNTLALAGDIVTLGVGNHGVKFVDAQMKSAVQSRIDKGGATREGVEKWIGKGWLSKEGLAEASKARVLTMGGIYGMSDGFSNEASLVSETNQFNQWKFLTSGVNGLTLGVVAAIPGAVAIRNQKPTTEKTSGPSARQTYRPIIPGEHSAR